MSEPASVEEKIEEVAGATDLKTNPRRPTVGLHPGVIFLAMLCVPVFLLALVFFVTGNLAADLNLFGVAGFAVIFFALTLGLAARASDDRRWGGPSKETFAEFTKDNVSTFTGTIPAREALVEVLVIPVCLAAGMVMIGFVFAMGL